MCLLISLLTMPLIYLSISEVKEKEKFYIIRLILLWLLCQIYITINMKFIFPIGIFISLYLTIKSKYNQKSKILAVLIGIFSFLLSILSYQIKV